MKLYRWHVDAMAPNTARINVDVIAPNITEALRLATPIIETKKDAYKDGYDIIKVKRYQTIESIWTAVPTVEEQAQTEIEKLLGGK